VIDGEEVLITMLRMILVTILGVATAALLPIARKGCSEIAKVVDDRDNILLITNLVVASSPTPHFSRVIGNTLVPVGQ
jgi:hypothetical protein